MTREEKKKMSNPECRVFSALSDEVKRLMASNAPHIEFMSTTGLWHKQDSGLFYPCGCYRVSEAAPVDEYVICCVFVARRSPLDSAPNWYQFKLGDITYSLASVINMPTFAGVQYRSSLQWYGVIDNVTHGTPAYVRFRSA